MYIHCFAFRWKPGVTEDQMDRAETEIKKLRGQIPGLLETYVGRNISPRGQGYTFGGVMKFADKASFPGSGNDTITAWPSATKNKNAPPVGEAYAKGP
jgi:hypothetical protein